MIWPAMEAQNRIDRANVEFWNELCGSTLARQLGLQDHSLESLRRFDEAYLNFYPYLLKHVDPSVMAGRDVLEIGLGFGTLGQVIASRARSYLGLDIAEMPVRMLGHRMRLTNLAGRAVQASMIDCPIKSESQDFVVSIGCFHHTGNVTSCIREAYRVLRPGGTAILMLYNRFSYRQWLHHPFDTLRALLRGPEVNTISETQRAAFDVNTSGLAAPETILVSETEVRGMCREFREVYVTKENSSDLRFLRWELISRDRLMGWLGNRAGLDLYIRATK